MNSSYLVTVSKLCQDLSNVTNQDISDLDYLKSKYTSKAEKAILNDKDTGKAYLSSNLREVLSQKDYFESKVRLQLAKFAELGLNDYDEKYSNAKGVILSVEDAVAGLLQLTTIYFTDLAEVYRNERKDYLPFDITRYNANQDRKVEDIESEHFLGSKEAGDTVFNAVKSALLPLSGSWNLHPKISPEAFQQLVEEVTFLIKNKKAPSRIQKIGRTGFPLVFIRKTFNLLYGDHFPTRSHQSRKLFISYIHSAFQQFDNVSEDTTNRKFKHYDGNYKVDRLRIDY